jgi:uncharacterized membrane protein HdeD (DUF308 family)
MSETAAGSELAGTVAELELKSVSERWGWFMALGILMVVLGAVAICAPLATGIAINLLIGWLLIISGVAHGVHAFRATGWRGALLQVLCGLLYLGVGIMMITNPVAGLLALTLTVLVYFVLSGIFKIILAIRVETLPQRGWVTASGILSLVLAIYIGSQFPTSALWVIGLLVGIEMMFSGWSFVMLALAARRVGGAQKGATAGGVEAQATG